MKNPASIEEGDETFMRTETWLLIGIIVWESGFIGHMTAVLMVIIDYDCYRFPRIPIK